MSNIYGPIWKRNDGSYTINDGTYHATEDYPQGIQPAEVEAYLAEHPEALVPEPVPPAPSAEELARQEEQTLLAYLASTDWYVIRQTETGGVMEVPFQISQDRTLARDRISELRNEIAAL